METSLPVFLLALFIIRGLSLECEECIGIEHCSGNMLPCGLGKDKCSVTNMALPIGLSVTIKSCVSSDVCDKGVQVINLGQRKHVVAHLRCCEGDECRDVPPSIPPELPMKAAANGKQCPACFAIHGTCDEKVIDCSGEELYCAEGLIVTSALEVGLKGCANKAFCDSLVAYEAMAPENSGHHAIQCISNSSIHQEEFTNLTSLDSSGVVNTNPRWFGLFVTIFSGLIFFQV